MTNKAGDPNQSRSALKALAWIDPASALLSHILVPGIFDIPEIEATRL